jgi:peptidoglycan/xylan/chitin deacetylase (PgdA/CDA1 family)
MANSLRAFSSGTTGSAGGAEMPRSAYSSEMNWSRRRFLGGAAAMGALGVGAAACGGSGSAASTGTSTVGGAPAVALGTSSSASASAGASASSGAVDADLIAHKYSGLKPFAAPPAPPAVKPITLSAADPTVISRIPTTEKIVFVTIDDGLEKEPAFIQMAKDFQVPYTLFLTDAIIKDNYGYFTQLLDTGLVTIQNHTLTHPDMPTLSAAQQLEQVGGQQHKLETEYGVKPYLFRPPYGNYNSGTISAVKQTSGLKGIALWKESMQISDMQYQGAHVLNPGDVILSHFRGPAQLKGETMIGMMVHLFKRIQAQGFTIARLTDYV